jgi:hypothetical protein
MLCYKERDSVSCWYGNLTFITSLISLPQVKYVCHVLWVTWVENTCKIIFSNLSPHCARSHIIRSYDCVQHGSNLNFYHISENKFPSTRYTSHASATPNPEIYVLKQFISSRILTRIFHCCHPASQTAISLTIRHYFTTKILLQYFPQKKAKSPIYMTAAFESPA